MLMKDLSFRNPQETVSWKRDQHVYKSLLKKLETIYLTTTASLNSLNFKKLIEPREVELQETYEVHRQRLVSKILG